VRGVGSIYYLAYALTAASFAGADQLWAIVSVTILASIATHGVTATPMMNLIDPTIRRRPRHPRPHHPSRPTACSLPGHDAAAADVGRRRHATDRLGAPEAPRAARP